MKINLNFIFTITVLSASANLHAAQFDFSGNIAYHNDVVQLGFTLSNEATNVRVWTDSFQNGTNFDPVTSVWSQSGSDWSLIGQNDDRSDIAVGQTSFDSGLTFDTLAAGNYRFSLTTFDNLANGTLLSDGFNFDDQTPIPLENWVQPSNNINMGSFYSLHFDGVDNVTQIPAVPEPETYAMTMAGLGLVAVVARRRKQLGTVANAV